MICTNAKSLFYITARDDAVIRARGGFGDDDFDYVEFFPKAIVELCDQNGDNTVDF